ncbi:hypothetical protein RCL1_007265 [Eukaryota sp. TZLM3-RCL]
MSKHCSNCDQDVPESNYLLHTMQCSKRVQRCQKCNVPVPIASLAQHEDEFHSVTVCDCGVTVPKHHLTDHKQNECPLRPIPCQFCDLSLPLSELVKHEIECGSRTSACDICGKRVRLSDMEKHITSICQEFAIGQSPKPVPKPLSRSERPDRRRDEFRTDDLFSRRLQPEPRPSKPPTLSSSSSRSDRFPQQRLTVPKKPSLPSSRPRDVSREFTTDSGPIARHGRSNRPPITSPIDTDHVPPPRFQVECGVCGRKFFDDEELQIHFFSECAGSSDQTPSPPKVPSFDFSPAPMVQENVEADLIPCEFCSELFPFEMILEHQDICPRK